MANVAFDNDWRPTPEIERGGSEGTTLREIVYGRVLEKDFEVLILSKMQCSILIVSSSSFRQCEPKTG